MGDYRRVRPAFALEVDILAKGGIGDRKTSKQGKGQVMREKKPGTQRGHCLWRRKFLEERGKR